MEVKTKVRFLTAVWGARYVHEFARISLPSFLAPGNLPHLASHTDLEVVVLTTADSLQAFEQEPAFQRLSSICNVRFIMIDDLVTNGNYGVTLTLAYARGIIDAGAEQTNTWFVFMNSDFVLAEGGMRTLVRCFIEGRRCILSASLRARAEEALPVLKSVVSTDGIELSIAPRDAVRLALRYPHATVLAKTITQSLVTCSTHNQLYWGVDADTLLARNHLIFMLAIRPERRIFAVNSYCDYGFVPELVPSGEHYVIGDSDDFFMLELQPAKQEMEFVRCGATKMGDVAAELSRWTTKEHRAFARHDVVFHSAALPQELSRVREEARRYVEVLHRQMTEPLDHKDHFYWTFGVQAWKYLKANELGMDDLPTELVPEELRHAPIMRYDTTLAAMLTRRVQDYARGQYVGVVGRLRAASGTMPDVRPWHHRYPDARLLQNWLASVRNAQNCKTLIVADETGPVVAKLAEATRADCIVTSGFRSISKTFTARDRYDEVLILVTRKNVRSTGALFDELEPVTAENGRISVFIDHPNAELDPSDFTSELAAYTDSVFPAKWLNYEVEAEFVGGRMRRRLRLLQRSVERNLIPAGFGSLPRVLVSAVIWPPIAASILAVNWLQPRAPRHAPFATSVMLKLRKKTTSSQSAAQEMKTVDSSSAA